MRVNDFNSSKGKIIIGKSLTPSVTVLMNTASLFRIALVRPQRRAVPPRANQIRIGTKYFF